MILTAGAIWSIIDQAILEYWIMVEIMKQYGNVLLKTENDYYVVRSGRESIQTQNAFHALLWYAKFIMKESQWEYLLLSF